MSEPRMEESRYVRGARGEWEVVVGVEVHAQVLSKAKLFSGAPTAFGAEPNTQVSFVDAAMPGMLPVINRFCVEQAIRTGLGLKAQINRTSTFDRKNYFYPDLPAGYQISQYKHPIVGEGEVLLDLPKGRTVRVGIERLHLEQDAGKSLHDQHPDHSLVDLNRAGVALMEIVSRPDMRSSEEAAAFVKKLRAILRYLGTCDGNMDEGSLRADVNVSVRRPGDALGTRCEIKNVNSMRFIAQAIEYEARRQIEILEGGGTIVQETRLFDSRSGSTRAMRSKEEAHDYRYFPDPDLLPLVIDEGWIGEIAAALPELPDDKKARFIRDYAISAYDAGVLTAERELAAYYEDLVRDIDPKAAANWLNNEVLGRLNRDGLDIGDCPVSARANNAILKMIGAGKISGKIAKDVLDIVWTEGGDPETVVETRGLLRMTDTSAIEQAIEDVIASNPDKVAAARTKPNLLGWFVGQVMKQTGGKADPRAVNDLLRARIGTAEKG
jgi:aspartyl-tRNA(Asn)/glutamyl-tRNA(Gln) amidotransferase subunit B